MSEPGAQCWFACLMPFFSVIISSKEPCYLNSLSGELLARITLGRVDSVFLSVRTVVT